MELRATEEASRYTNIPRTHGRVVHSTVSRDERLTTTYESDEGPPCRMYPDSGWDVQEVAYLLTYNCGSPCKRRMQQENVKKSNSMSACAKIVSEVLSVT